ncbi:MAG: flagellar basal-body rod protein FlgG [Bacillota bacterium]|nr:MAG: flagellar basal body rod protein FlgG [Bacillota bacterium]
MIRALYSAASGMAAQQVQTDVIANNLANVNTPGYKASRAAFEDLLYQELQAGPDTPGPVQLGNGVRLAATQRSFQQGSLTRTGEPLHVAIQGPGFLRVRREDGTEAYTRDGSLSLSGAGQLVTAQGLLVLSEFGTPIQVPPGAADVQIGSDGLVTYWDSQFQQRVPVGRIGLASFVNPGGLLALGGNLYQATPNAGAIQYGAPGQYGLGTLLPGHLENSNVEVVTEMVNLIVAQRVYELNSRALQSADEMLAMVNQLRR